ncbi:MAG: hypothetical protein R3C05_31365 [Pirellulaceae bacterium]
MTTITRRIACASGTCAEASFPWALRTFGILIALLWSSTSEAQLLREGDEYWVINTRHISSNACHADLDSPRFSVYRYHDNIGLQFDSVEGLLSTAATDADCLNILYIHGNRMKSQEAIDRSLKIYRLIQNRRCDQTKIRWILWSWPSDPIFNPLTDVRQKAARADAQALYVGWFLRRFPAIDRIEMIGYSFGGRIVTGALHTAAGGAMFGRTLPGPPLSGARIGINLVAPALDRHWLANGAKHGMAVENIGSLNLFYNSGDRVLKLYKMVSKYYDPVALGSAGLGPLGTRSDQLPIAVVSRNCVGTVGLIHDELLYYEPGCDAAPWIARSIDKACDAITQSHPTMAN